MLPDLHTDFSRGRSGSTREAYLKRTRFCLFSLVISADSQYQWHKIQVILNNFPLYVCWQTSVEHYSKKRFFLTEQPLSYPLLWKLTIVRFNFFVFLLQTPLIIYLFHFLIDYAELVFMVSNFLHKINMYVCFFYVCVFKILYPLAFKKKKSISGAQEFLRT